MRRVLVVLLVLLVIGLLLGGCSVDDKTKVSEPTSLSGTWVAESFKAEVSDNLIVVTIISEDSSSLYWRGTFPSSVGETVISVGDVDAMSQSILGSMDSEKKFTVLKDEIQFKISIGGSSKVVHLKRA